MQAFLFPGQGSQIRGMGQSLFDSVDEFRSCEKDIDDILGYSLRRMCLEDPDGKLRQTRYTQPALFVVNALHYYRALAEGKQAEYAAGHSLGEYNALMSAGAFDFFTGIKLVQKRAELMDQIKNGGMAAIIGIDADMVAQVLSDHKLSELDIANYNAPLQTVISGPAFEIEGAEEAFRKVKDHLFVVLPVSAPFHSRYMAPAAAEFAKFLNGFKFNELRSPVIANVTGQAYPTGEATGVIRAMLVDQIVKPVRWMQSVQLLLQLGVSDAAELGPGNVLTRLQGQIKAG